MRNWRRLRRLSLLLLLYCGTHASAFGDTLLNVSINTSAINGSSGKLVFDLTVNAPGTGDHAIIENFSAPGATLGLPETLGGLVSGDLILGLNPAPFTIIDGDFFFNELTLNFIKFSNSLTFVLDLPNLAPLGGNPPDEFALFMLNKAGLPLFPTGDPLGANALFTVDVGSPSSLITVFSPTTRSGNNLSVVVPGQGNGQVPEPSTWVLLTSGLILLILYRSNINPQ
jgi:hypothetical protein